MDSVEKSIYLFGPTTDGDASMKEVLGGKGANLAEMASLGISVPPGFTIPCRASVKYNQIKDPTKAVMFMEEIRGHIEHGLEYLKNCFNGDLPLVSVRSGARVSMPGMMDTILNVGLTTETLPKWEEKIGARAARDSYRRLIQMYSSVALNIPMFFFDNELDELKESCGVVNDKDLDETQLDRLIQRYLTVVKDAGETFPDTVIDQIVGAVGAVFESWNNDRAIEYRKIHGYPADWGTAANIQSMVFGNMNDQSATGVVFTRCPSTGDPKITGEFLVNAQGEDVVAGIRTPEPIQKMVEWNAELSEELAQVLKELEDHYKDMQDVEFTVQDGKLYILQTRSGKRSPSAAVKIAMDLFFEEKITAEMVKSRVSIPQMLAASQAYIPDSFKKAPLVTGIPAGGGVVTGIAAFSSHYAINCKKPCILVRKETDPDDIGGMNASIGILTTTGGLTSHAAVVARGMNKSCVVGATNLEIQSGHLAGVNGQMAFSQGDEITIDGATGRVWAKTQVPVVDGGLSESMEALVALRLLGGDFNWEDTEGYFSATPIRLDWSYDMDQDSLNKAIKFMPSPVLYVDTAVIPPHITADWDHGPLERLGKALHGYEGARVILDLSSPFEGAKEVDRAYLEMYGMKDMPGRAMNMASDIVKWSSDVLTMLVVKLPDGAGAASNILSSKGVKTMGQVSRVSDILEASGPISVSPAIIASVFGTMEAYKAVVDMVEKTKGVKLSGEDKQPRYWYDEEVN